MMKSASLRAAAAPRAAVKVAAVKRADKAVLLASTAALLSAAPARAEEAAAAASGVDTAINTAVELVKAAGLAVKAGLVTVDAGVAVLKQGYEVAAPVVAQGYAVVAPVVEEAVRAAAPVLSSAAPVVQQTLDDAVKASGVPVSAIGSTASTVLHTAQDGAAVAAPYVATASAFLTGTDPTTLAEYGLAAVALYYASPLLLSAAGEALRGYAGELAAPAALNMINTDGNTVLIDLRSAKEKESAGVPDVAGGARDRVVEVELAVTEDRRLRGQLRNAGAIENQVTAMQIAALKRIGRGTRVVLLDRNGGAAKDIARELGRKGFGRVYIVAGGFEGRAGWVQSKLQIKPAAISSSSPLGTIAAGRRALPAPRG